MNKTRILLDMDGVMADFVTHACMVHGKENPYVSPEMYGRYDIASVLGMSETAFWKPMGREFWATIPLTPEAEMIMCLLKSYVPEEQICFLSSPNLNPECMVGKLEWVEKHFPSFRRRFLFGPKKEFCAHNRNILIDDHDNNVKTFAEAGGLSILFPRPWNKLHYKCNYSAESLAYSLRTTMMCIESGA